MDKKQEKVSEICKKIANEDIYKKMLYLSFRWRDEKEFEDWGDYEKNMASFLSNCGIEFIKGTKRPFGFIFKFENIKIHIFLKKKSGCAWLAGKLI